MTRPLRLFAVYACLLCLIFTALAGCSDVGVTTTGSATEPSASVTPVPTTSPDPTTTGSETGPEPPLLIDLEQIGRFATGHTLLLPGGQWYDSSGQDVLVQISDMTVAAGDIGRPTISRPPEEKPLLRLEGCGQIVFRQVRFGYERADFLPGDVFTDIPLIEIVDSVSIRFEQCEFFGSGTAIYLENAENIIFEDCQFYNLAGRPFTTDEKGLPSQVYVRGSSFESAYGGQMPLNLRASHWENCTFMGFDSYCVPVLSGSCAPAGSLAGELFGLLSARVSYHTDENRRLTVRNCLFTSRETYSLFGSLESEIKAALPAGWSGLALTGQKLEEQEPGRPLDPTLGLTLELRVASGGPAGNGQLYDTARMQSDLEPLTALAPLLDGLISGRLGVRIHDQGRRPLLSISLLPADINTLLQADPRGDLSRLGRIILLDDSFIPAEFTGRNSGYIIARDAGRNIAQALQTDAEALIVWPDSEDGRPCQLELELEFTGTRLTEAAADHRFSLFLHRYTAASLEECHELTVLAEISVRADNGEKTDLLAGNNGRRFAYATDAEKTALEQALAQPLQLTDGREFFLLQTEEGIEWARTPVLVYRSDEIAIELKLVLYDQEIKPQAFILTLEADEAADWRITGAEDTY